MPALQTFPSLSHSTVIRCDRCGGRARLKQLIPAITPGKRGEMFSFECEDCHHRVQKAADD